jgi:hypothetical protein
VRRPWIFTALMLFTQAASGEPAASLATASGIESSVDSLLVLSRVTTCLQYGHFAMDCSFRGLRRAEALSD